MAASSLHTRTESVYRSQAGDTQSPLVCIAMPDAKLRVEQWQLLRRLAAQEMSSSELAEVLGRRTSSVSRGLRILERVELVEPREEGAHAGPGQPKCRWALTSAGRDALSANPLAPESSVAEAPEALEADEDPRHRHGPWPISAGESYVEVALSSQELPGLLAVLAGGELAVEASFVIRLDGAGHRYLFVFDRRLGARPAEAFAAALRAVELPFSLGTIGDARSVDAMVRDARAAAAAARSIERDHASLPDPPLRPD